MTHKTVIALLIIIAAAPAIAEARPRCVNEYHPMGPVFSQDAIPCISGIDMGYIDNQGEPFTKFHFLHTVAQERRDYFAKQIRKNLPWRIANPKISDDVEK